MSSNAASKFAKIADEVLKEGGEFSFRAAGHSMTPFIQDAEIVIIAPPVRRLRIGDVILFSSGEHKLTLHRIIRKTPYGYITRGDAALEEDGEIRHDAVIGKAVHIAGGMNLHLRFPLGMFVAYALRLRRYPLLFRLMKLPARVLKII